MRRTQCGFSLRPGSPEPHAERRGPVADPATIIFEIPKPNARDRFGSADRSTAARRRRYASEASVRSTRRGEPAWGAASRSICGTQRADWSWQRFASITFGAPLNRRHFLQASIALPLLSLRSQDLLAAGQAASIPFDASLVRQAARDLASKPFKAPGNKMPDALKNLDYDHYRAIRFAPDHALWRGEKLPFEVQFFHRGFFFTDRVDIHEVAAGQATRIAYQPEFFSFGSTPAPQAGADLGFAGFRLHTPINKPDYYDEVCVFLGASYFRAVAK